MQFLSGNIKEGASPAHICSFVLSFAMDFVDFVMDKLFLKDSLRGEGSANREEKGRGEKEEFLCQRRGMDLLEYQAMPSLCDLTKAVNREDKRSRRYRDRHFVKFEMSRRYRER